MPRQAGARRVSGGAPARDEHQRISNEQDVQRKGAHAHEVKGGVGAPIREEQRAHGPRHAEGIEELPGELPPRREWRKLIYIASAHRCSGSRPMPYSPASISSSERSSSIVSAAPAVTRRIRTRRAGVQRLYLLHSRSHAASAASSHRICSGGEESERLSEPGTIENQGKRPFYLRHGGGLFRFRRLDCIKI